MCALDSCCMPSCSSCAIILITAAVHSSVHSSPFVACTCLLPTFLVPFRLLPCSCARFFDASPIHTPSPQLLHITCIISFTPTTLTLTRPSALPAATSASSSCNHCGNVTRCTPRCCNRSARAAPPTFVPPSLLLPCTCCTAPEPTNRANLFASTSSTIHPTVSSASIRLVPMIPVGPRFSQPHTYSPGSTPASSLPEARLFTPAADRLPGARSTRPAWFGTTPFLASKGRPARGWDL
mmetsp:Transcript_25951/g.56540  ORF Transcript_25951/g.56540 Transcript_25951/m.56540 type:complete len:238 (+) Transcript_25951:322-1035(+)